MRYIMFQKQIIDKIKIDGTKSTTMRATTPQAALKQFPLHCEVSLRYWENKPCRSKQIEFARARIVNIQLNKLNYKKISIKLFEVMYGRNSIMVSDVKRLNIIARLDGLESFVEMFTWFIINHGDSFKGSRIGFEVI